MVEVGNAFKVVESGEQLKHRTSPDPEEGEPLRRRRWRCGAAVLTGGLALGAGLTLAAHAGAPNHSGSESTARTRGPNLLASSLKASSTEPGKVPKLRFSTQQAGLAGWMTAKERSVGCRWVVPAVPISAYLDSRIRSTEAAQMWIGTSGTAPGSVIQVGVEVTTRTTEGVLVHYRAFWDLTGRLHLVAHLVDPGDELHASIYESSLGSDWVVTVADVTQGWRLRQTVSYHGRERIPLWFEGAQPFAYDPTRGTSVASLVPLKPLKFKGLRINGRPPEPGRFTYFEMVNTTTRQAIVPRYTSRNNSLTMTQTSADSVLRHKPL